MNGIHSNSVVSPLNAQYRMKDENAKIEKLKVNGYLTSSGNFFLKKLKMFGIQLTNLENDL